MIPFFSCDAGAGKIKLVVKKLKVISALPLICFCGEDRERERRERRQTRKGRGMRAVAGGKRKIKRRNEGTGRLLLLVKVKWLG